MPTLGQFQNRYTWNNNLYDVALKINDKTKGECVKTKLQKTVERITWGSFFVEDHKGIEERVRWS